MVSILELEESEVTKFIIKQLGSYLLEKLDIEEQAKIFYMLVIIIDPLTLQNTIVIECKHIKVNPYFKSN